MARRFIGHRLPSVLIFGALVACGGSGSGDSDASPTAYARVDDAAVNDASSTDAAPMDAAPLTECNDCHGDHTSSAPPKDTNGNVATSFAGVGAHRAHLRDSTLFRSTRCIDCHVVPDDVDDPGHNDDMLPAEVVFAADSVARADGVTPDYTDGACTVYCHGVTRSGGAQTVPEWTSTLLTCESCHDLPPPDPHPELSVLACGPCHPFNGLTPIDPSTHVDGTLQVASCGACHDIPPSTGAHAIHYGENTLPPLAVYGDLRTVDDYYPGGVDHYMFGCGNCHPTDTANHADGTVQVELYDPAADPGSLKSMHPATATYSNGTCSDVYCHSSGQELPSYVETPAWSNGAFTNRCASCHANPPNYPSGGAGAADANLHLVMGDDEWEYGHFGGLPGPWHGSYHGGNGAAPITCQTCHYDTTDPANTGSGGIYWLDTTGDYDLGGWLGFACGDCHTGDLGDPEVGSGEILTSAHVNGARDVVFDPRTSLPPSGGLPDPPNTPTYPYWVNAGPPVPPPDSVQDGTTWSLHLDNASYDSTTKACSNVPCHLAQSFGTGAPQWDPLVWGTTPVGNATCNACHQY